jgi:hypothetical protein
MIFDVASSGNTLCEIVKFWRSKSTVRYLGSSTRIFIAGLERMSYDSCKNVRPITYCESFAALLRGK